MASTVPGGIETPDFLELRKRREGTDAAVDEGPKSLYTVLPEKETRMRGLMGSDRVYDISGVAPAAPVLGQEDRGKKVSGMLFLRSWLKLTSATGLFV